MPRNAKKGKRRVVIDTNVLLAGISGFKGAYLPGKNPSADLLFRWADHETFIWLVTEQILEEYKEVLGRRNVRAALIGGIINLIRERAEQVAILQALRISPDPDDDAFCRCAEEGQATAIITLNIKDFPRDKLTAKILTPTEFLAQN